MTNQHSESNKSTQLLAEKIATVTVTYNPSILGLVEQINTLPKQTIKVIVDNGSGPEDIKNIQRSISNFENIHLIKSEKNIGLAAGINLGVNYLSQIDQCPELVLLLDQDSVPEAESIKNLLIGYRELQDQGHNVGCVGPLLIDPDTGLTHGFHQMTRFRWMRAYPKIGSLTPVPCANLNGSGTLVPVKLFQQLGGLDKMLFIDHVDTEWAFRVIAHGYSLWGIPNAIFKHSMGEASTRFWFFGWRIWPVRSAWRHYYLFRNAAILFKRSYIPIVWKMWAIPKLLMTAVVMGVIGPRRKQQLRNMWQGILEGLGDYERKNR